MRIVSLLPSATEIVCELGLADQLVGVSHECDYPDSIRGIPIVTRSKLPSDLNSFQIDQIVRQDFQAQASLFSLRLDLLSELAPDLIDLAGGRECIGRSGSKSESISWERLVDANPDVLLIACCGYTIPKTLKDLPSLQGRPGFQELRAVRNHRVFIADGNAYFNRPGPRLVDTLEMIAHCLHPKQNPLPSALESGLHRMDPKGQS